MTVVEEVGGETEGASALDPSLVSGSILLNLDSEEDGKLTVGSASSTDSTIRVERPREGAPADTLTLSVSAAGGLGGHSGTDIDRGRANAIKVLARALREAHSSVPFRLASFAGGMSSNAIPRDAVARCVVPSAREEELRTALQTAAEEIRRAYERTDPAVRVSVERTAAEADAWTERGTAELLDVVAVLPSGPLARSVDFDALVETSSSLGTAATDGAALALHSLTRSSNDAALPEVLATLAAAARLARGTFTVDQMDPSWRADLDSPTLAVMRRVYERVFGEPPVVTAVHAWLETAVIGEHFPGGLDMVSFGPQIEAPHSPDERVSIPTVERFWQLLVAVVDELSAPRR
jgi:dipeptidase D